MSALSCARYTCLELFAAIVLLSTSNTSFYYALLLTIRKLYLSYKFPFSFFVISCNTIINRRQVHLQPPKSFDRQHKTNIEKRGSIRGWMIVVREIVTLV